MQKKTKKSDNTLAEVIKEMAKPRVAMSARKQIDDRSPDTKTGQMHKFPRADLLDCLSSRTF
jgi:hypothetical protein